MKFNNDFRYDLKYGQQEEVFIHELLSEQGEIKLEVKSDRKAQYTGNVYIEYQSRGKPSGLSTTEAGYYVFKFKNGLVLMLPVEKLKKFCNTLTEKKRSVKGGDNNSSLGCLVKVEDLVKFSLLNL